MHQNSINKFYSSITLWTFKKSNGIVMFYNISLLHKNYLVSNRICKTHFMSDHQHGHTFFCQVCHYFQYISDHFWVKS